MSWSCPVFFPIVHSVRQLFSVLIGKTGPSEFSTTLGNDTYLDFQTTHEHQIKLI